MSGILASASDFGTEAEFTFGEASNVINVLFEENYRGYDVYGNEVANLGPIALCSTSDVTDENGNVPGEDSTKTASLVINGVTYKVTKCARESEGASTLILSKD